MNFIDEWIMNIEMQKEVQMLNGSAKLKGTLIAKDDKFILSFDIMYT